MEHSSSTISPDINKVDGETKRSKKLKRQRRRAIKQLQQKGITHAEEDVVVIDDDVGISIEEAKQRLEKPRPLVFAIDRI